MIEPKLALIPSAYKANKVYSVLPSSGVGDFDFTRSGDATRVNKEGLIEVVGSNVPRLNYPLIDGVVSGCPSLLLEPSRSNLITYSEEFGSTGWSFITTGSAIAPIVSDNYAISPDGTQNAQRIQFDLGGGTTTSDRTIIRQSLSTQTDWFLSVWMKSTDGTEQKILWHTTADSNETVVTGEWQRFTFSRNGVSNSWAGLGLRGGDSDVDTADILVYGFQAEQGSYATSYIPTQGAIGTRVGESCSDAGNNQVINSTEGVLYFEGSSFIDSDFKSFSLSDGSVSDGDDNRVMIGFQNSILYANVRVGNVHQFNENLNIPINNNNKIALKYKTNDFALWINGNEILSGNSGTTFSQGVLKKLQFADGRPTTSVFNGNCKDLRVYNTALSDAELQALTKI